MQAQKFYNRLFKPHRKILCIGKNYLKHVNERAHIVGMAEVPTSPLWFDKPFSSIITNSGNVLVPKGGDVHHEVELCLLWGKTAKNVKKEEWRDFVKGYAVGIDFTDRLY